MHRCAIAVGVVACAGSAASAGMNPWADTVVNYDPGTNANSNYLDATAALGEPSRFTGDNAPFASPGAVTPFNGAFNIDQVVTLGSGGSITLGFDEPITNDAANPYGIDLLIFGNSSYLDTDFPNGQAGDPAALFGEGGVVELSADGMMWVTATGISADGAFPTLGYTDLLDPFSPTHGAVETDFTRPVDPSFSADGLSFAEIIAGYNGSGGGAGIDIGAYGLSEVRFVRISNPIGSGFSPEIDAVVDVSIPSPGAVSLCLTTTLIGSRRRRG
ncbi:MAG: hypothetical protein RLN60_05495 [Phycisphaerales bacterium]